MARSTPSIRICPEVAVWNPQIRLMMVDLPDPDDPTRAVTVPGFDSKLMSVQHRLVLLVFEDHILELDIAVYIERTQQSGVAVAKAASFARFDRP